MKASVRAATVRLAAALSQFGGDAKDEGLPDAGGSLSCASSKEDVGLLDVTGSTALSASLQLLEQHLSHLDSLAEKQKPAARSAGGGGGGAGASRKESVADGFFSAEKIKLAMEVMEADIPL